MKIWQYLPQIIITGSGIADTVAIDMTRVSPTEYTYDYAVPVGDGIGTITLSTGTDLFTNVVTATPPVEIHYSR